MMHAFMLFPGAVLLFVLSVVVTNLHHSLMCPAIAGHGVSLSMLLCGPCSSVGRCMQAPLSRVSFVDTILGSGSICGVLHSFLHHTCVMRDMCRVGRCDLPRPCLDEARVGWLQCVCVSVQASVWWHIDEVRLAPYQWAEVLLCRTGVTLCDKGL